MADKEEQIVREALDTLYKVVRDMPGAPKLPTEDERIADLDFVPIPPRFTFGEYAAIGAALSVMTVDILENPDVYRNEVGASFIKYTEGALRKVARLRSGLIGLADQGTPPRPV